MPSRARVAGSGTGEGPACAASDGWCRFSWPPGVPPGAPGAAISAKARGEPAGAGTTGQASHGSPPAPLAPGGRRVAGKGSPVPDMPGFAPVMPMLAPGVFSAIAMLPDVEWFGCLLPVMGEPWRVLSSGLRPVGAMPVPVSLSSRRGVWTAACTSGEYLDIAVDAFEVKSMSKTKMTNPFNEERAS